MILGSRHQCCRRGEGGLGIRLGMRGALGMRVGRSISLRGRMDGWGCLIGGEGDVRDKG